MHVFENEVFHSVLFSRESSKAKVARFPTCMLLLVIPYKCDKHDLFENKVYEQDTALSNWTSSSTLLKEILSKHCLHVVFQTSYTKKTTTTKNRVSRWKFEGLRSNDIYMKRLEITLKKIKVQFSSIYSILNMINFHKQRKSRRSIVATSANMYDPLSSWDSFIV